MATQTKPQAPSIQDPFADMRHKAMEAMSAYAEANQRVLGELVNLSSVAVKETVRVYAELEAATLEAIRPMATLPVASPASFEELTKDPLAGYRQGMLAVGEGPQRLLKLVDNNSQIMGQGAQRFQASAERSGAEIREALTGYFNRIGEIYSRG